MPISSRNLRSSDPNFVHPVDQHFAEPGEHLMRLLQDRCIRFCPSAYTVGPGAGFRNDVVESAVVDDGQIGFEWHRLGPF